MKLWQRSERTYPVAGVIPGCLLCVSGVLFAGAAHAQIDLTRGQRAVDGTAYAVIAVNDAPLQSGVDQMRGTTVAGSVNGLRVCSSNCRSLCGPAGG